MVPVMFLHWTWVEVLQQTGIMAVVAGLLTVALYKKYSH